MAASGLSRVVSEYNPERIIPFKLAKKIAQELVSRGSFKVYGIKIYIVGGVRRREHYVKDLDLLIVLPTRLDDYLDDALKDYTLNPPDPSDIVVGIVDTYLHGSRHKSIVLRLVNGKYVLADLFAARFVEKPFALFHYTGHKTYSIRIRAYAKRKNLLLNQYGIYNATTGEPAAGSEKIHTEKALIEFLGVTHRLPSDRH